MTPYYQDSNATLYCGDSRDILPSLEITESIITDPVWPNATVELIGRDRPLALFREVAKLFNAKRLVIQLGCDSDPRFLKAVPAKFPFLRTCWLRYAAPHYKGRLLYTSDIAYVFGTWANSVPGAHVFPGETVRTDAVKNKTAHPCPRPLTHTQWVVKWFGGASVLDPFAGSGTTGVAAKMQNKKAILIEIDEQFCEIAAKRIQESVSQITLV